MKKSFLISALHGKESRSSFRMTNRISAEFASLFHELRQHGWPKVFSSRKVIWLLLCCVSLGFFFEFTKRVISSYYKRETYLAMKATSVDSLRLPAVTFCNTNLHIDETRYLGDAYIPMDQTLPPNCSNYNSADFVNEINKQFFDNACKVFMAMSRNATIGSNHYSFNLKFPDNFSFVPNFWPCYTLNKNGHIMQSVSGMRRGLKILLFFNETDISGNWMKFPNWHMMDYRSGIYVDIHDQQYHIGRLEGIMLSPGFHTVIQIKKIISKRQRSPFPSNCYDDSFNQNARAIPGKYTIESCLMTCQLNYIYKKCGSIGNVAGPFVNRALYPQKSNMSSAEFNLCTLSAVESSNIANECKCQIPCDQIEYETQTSYMKWPQSWELQRLRPILSDVTGIPEKDIDAEFMRKHLIQVSIFYADLIETTIIEEVVYGFEKVISDFGGQMGMFLGASFLSLAEIIITIYDITKSKFRRPITDEQIDSVNKENN